MCMIQHAFKGHSVTQLPYCNLSSSDVVRRSVCLVRHALTVITSLKLQGQLLLFLVQSISTIKEIKIVQLMVLHVSPPG